jgi:hypothetical protein
LIVGAGVEEELDGLGRHAVATQGLSLLKHLLQVLLYHKKARINLRSVLALKKSLMVLVDTPWRPTVSAFSSIFFKFSCIKTKKLGLI